MDYRYFLGVVTLIIALFSYSFYFRDIFHHHTKPHVFSWFIWGLLMSVNFFAQISDNAGPGSWVIGFTALICFAISLLALRNGMKNIKLLDWFSLGGALISLFLFFAIRQPVLSVILVTITYSLGFLPTFRKSINRPQDETLITFVLNGSKFFISLFALSHISFVTAFYPFVLTLINWSFAGLLYLRSKQLRHQLKWFHS